MENRELLVGPFDFLQLKRVAAILPDPNRRPDEQEMELWVLAESPDSDKPLVLRFKDREDAHKFIASLAERAGAIWPYESDAPETDEPEADEHEC